MSNDSLVLPSQNQPQQKAGLLQEWQFPGGIIKPQMLAASPTMALGDIYYVNASGIFQKLPAGNTGQVLTIAGGVPSWVTPTVAAPLTSHAGYFTRDIAGANGDVAYTGAGFTPTVVQFFYTSADGKCSGAGSVDSAKNMNAYFNAQTAGYVGADSTTAKCIYLSNAGSTNQQALLKSFDADGFTLTWNKTGSPTGTGNIGYLALK